MIFTCIYWHKRKIYNFDPYNVLLAIATNIPVLLMTGFVVQVHIYIIGITLIIWSLLKLFKTHCCLGETLSLVLFLSYWIFSSCCWTSWAEGLLIVSSGWCNSHLLIQWHLSHADLPIHIVQTVGRDSRSINVSEFVSREDNCAPQQAARERETLWSLELWITLIIWSSKCLMHEEEDDRRYIANQILYRELIFLYIWSLQYAMKWLYFCIS